MLRSLSERKKALYLPGERRVTTPCFPDQAVVFIGIEVSHLFGIGCHHLGRMEGIPIVAQGGYRSKDSPAKTPESAASLRVFFSFAGFSLLL